MNHKPMKPEMMKTEANSQESNIQESNKDESNKSEAIKQEANTHETLKLSSQTVREIASELGFDLIGFTPYEMLVEEAGRLEDWLANGYNAGMQYMERNQDKRRDVRLVFPGAKGIVSLGMNYYTAYTYAGQPDNGRISRYAWGRDYHYVMWEKLEVFKNRLREIDTSFQAVSYVDTGPVMDKAWAVRAGLGWMGKNSNIISRQIGSWFFIATVITNHEFTASAIQTDHCGECRRCIDACPTGAIVKEGVIDANRCISYLTIENKGDIDPEFRESFQDWIFGCDICQDVCPWNIKFAKECNKDEFRPVNTFIRLSEVFNMTGGEFKRKFRESPVERTRLKGLRRNAAFLLGA